MAAVVEDLVLLDEKSLVHLYQPVFYLKHYQVCGFEVLLRSESGASPQALFLHAHEKGVKSKLDILSIRKSIETFSSSKVADQHHLLFINAYPSTLTHRSFPHVIDNLLEKMPGSRQEIVFEIMACLFIMKFSKLNIAFHNRS